MSDSRCSFFGIPLGLGGCSRDKNNHVRIGWFHLIISSTLVKRQAIIAGTLNGPIGACKARSRPVADASFEIVIIAEGGQETLGESSEDIV